MNGAGLRFPRVCMIGDDLREVGIRPLQLV